MAQSLPDFSEEFLDLMTTLMQRLRMSIASEYAHLYVQKDEQEFEELRAVTAGQIRFLRILISQKRCTMQALAAHLDVAQPSVTAMVKRLLRQKLVERVHDESDWRVVWVQPTEKGLHVTNLYQHLRKLNFQRRLTHLDQEEIELLRTVLPVLHNLIEVES